MAMVVNANRLHNGIGGHISTFASSATLYEVGFNHFFRGGQGEHPGDMVYFRATPRPAIMRALFSKAGWRRITWRIFARNWPKAAGFRPIRIPI